jgi:hypothetical protein
MGLFSRLFGGGGDDPTKGWPAAASGPTPTVSLERQALETFGGRLKFGDPLESARVLGRPDRCQADKGFATLEYHHWALTLEFEEGKFVQATFAIGDGNIGPSGEARGPDGLGLSGRTTKDEVRQRFGEPEKTQSFDDETIVYYSQGPLTSEFQFDEDGRLFAWDVYVD